MYQFTNPNNCLKTACSSNSDPEKALRELAREFDSNDFALVLIFLPRQDLEAEEISRIIPSLFGQMHVFAASSAGQITKDGYRDDCFLALGFSSLFFNFHAKVFTSLEPFLIDEIVSEAQLAYREFKDSSEKNQLGILISDGLSKKEDFLISALTACLPDLPIFGGSTAEIGFKDQSLIYAYGETYTNAALFLLVETQLDFSFVCFDHFRPTSKKVVVTEAEPMERVIYEINGGPAAQEYASTIGVGLHELTPELFAKNPFLIQLGGAYHVRSIKEAHEDNSLSLFCSLDPGLVLTIGEAGNIFETMEVELSNCVPIGRKASFILAFDCFLRRLEIEQSKVLEISNALLSANRVFGFSTYGEQHSGLHVNQTFVGIAFYQSENHPPHDKPKSTPN